MPPRPHRTANRNLDPGDVRSIRRCLARDMSIRECARVHQCDPKTIRNVRAGGLHCRDTRKAKKPCPKVVARRKLVAAMIKKTRTIHGRKHKVYPSCVSMARELKVSTSTINRDLGALGYVNRARPKKPKLSDDDCQKRDDFCRQSLANFTRDQLELIAFSDEKLFDTNDHGLKREWVRKGEEPTPREYQKWSPRVMVWGVIATNYRALHFFPEGCKVDAVVYQGAIKSALRVLKNRRMTFMQDGARCHTAASTMTFIEQSGVNVLQHYPARSPDLNPIENMWSLVDRRVSEFYEGNLRDAVEKAWNSISRDTVNALVWSYQSRLLKVASLEGKFSQ